MFHFHKWTKWEEYIKPIVIKNKYTQVPIKAVETWQKRTCIKCGYTQRKEVDEY